MKSMIARRLSQQVAVSWSSLIFKPGLVKRLIHTKPLLYSDTCYSSSRKLPFHHLPKCRFFTSGREAFFISVLEELGYEYRDEMEEEHEREWLRLLASEDEEDYVGLHIQKLAKKNLKKLKGDASADLDLFEEPTDSESDDDDEQFSPNNLKKRFEQFEKLKRHEKLLKNFLESDTRNAYKWINRIYRFEDEHFRLHPEYRIIGELINSLQVPERRKKSILQQKLNTAMRMVIQHEQVGPFVGLKEKDDDDEEFDDMKENDDMLIEKINEIDKVLEEKLAQLDHILGKKGKALEEEIRDIAEERNALTEKKRKPLYRKVMAKFFCIAFIKAVSLEE